EGQDRLQQTLERFEALQYGLEDTLRGAGHGVTAVNGTQLRQALAAALDPTGQDTAALSPDLPLRDQCLQEELRNVEGGWRYGWTQQDGRFAERQRVQMLSLYRVAPQLYPGILTAPRAPAGAERLGLWEAWDGPMSLVTNIAAVQAEDETQRL